MNRYNFNKTDHVHSLDEKELMGCSTIVGIINKPLQWWVAEQTLLPFGWQKYNKKVKGKYQIVPDKVRLPGVQQMQAVVSEMKPKVFLEFLDSCYKNHNVKKDKAAEKGTDLHSKLEVWVKLCMDHFEGKPIAEPIEGIELFTDWARSNVKTFLWSEMHTYSEVLWTGGVADVGWLDHEDRVVAGDFKSAKDVWFSHFIQLAGYNIMLEESGGYTAEGEKIFDLPKPAERYCIAAFGKEVFDPIILDYVDDFKAAFKSSVHLYKLSKLFDKVKLEINKASMKAAEPSKTATLAELLAA